MGRLPGTAVRRLSVLPEGAVAVRCDEQGDIFQSYHQLFQDLTEHLTTDIMLESAAFNISSSFFKSALLSELGRLQNPNLFMLLDLLLRSWRTLDGSLLRSSGDQPGIVQVAADSSIRQKYPHLWKEPIDVIVVAFNLFRKQPGMFGWTGNENHGRATALLTTVLRNVFKSQVQGPQQHVSDSDSEDILADASEDTHLSPEDFEELVQEFTCVHFLRDSHDHVSVHPFSALDPQQSQDMLCLLKKLVKHSYPSICKFPRLAAVAVQHVESALEGGLLNTAPETVQVPVIIFSDYA